MTEKQNALVERDVTAVAPVSESASVLQMLERASRDPSVDVDKMARIMEMYERTQDRHAQTAYNQALAAMQTELPEIPRHGTIKNKSGGVQSKYAKWEDLNEIIKPILSRHGFALTFRTGNDSAKIVVTGVLSHAAGHSESSTMTLPIDNSGAKNEVQGLGSSTSYGKRYIAVALLNLTSRGEDDDGSGGKSTAEMDERRKNELMEGIAGTKNRKEADALWQAIAGEAKLPKDYDDLKRAMGAHIKTLEAL